MPRIAAATLSPGVYDRRRARYVEPLPWLSPEGNQQFAAAVVADMDLPHVGWGRSAQRLTRARSVIAMRCGVDLLARDHDVAVCHPLLEPSVIAAAGRQGGYLGLGGRSAAMRSIVGDLLPARVVTRETKGEFGQTLWTSDTLGWARANVPDVVAADTDLANLLWLEGLTNCLEAAVPTYMLTGLVQSAWLAAENS